MNGPIKTVTAKEARDNFTDILGMVYYGKEPVMVEKKGRPFAIVINPEEYDRYKEYKQTARKRVFEIIKEIRQANKGESFNKVYKDVTKIVEEVRKERYEKGKNKSASRR